MEEESPCRELAIGVGWLGWRRQQPTAVQHYAACLLHTNPPNTNAASLDWRATVAENTLDLDPELYTISLPT